MQTFGFTMIEIEPGFVHEGGPVNESNVRDGLTPSDYLCADPMLGASSRHLRNQRGNLIVQQSFFFLFWRYSGVKEQVSRLPEQPCWLYTLIDL